MQPEPYEHKDLLIEQVNRKGAFYGKVLKVCHLADGKVAHGNSWEYLGREMIGLTINKQVYDFVAVYNIVYA